VRQELPIEPVNRLVVDDRDAYLRFVVGRLVERPADRPFNQQGVDRRVGFVGERDLMPTFRRLLIVVGSRFLSWRYAHAEC
jgi:hypothetical protein